jgi:hypothetical protein
MRRPARPACAAALVCRTLHHPSTESWRARSRGCAIGAVLRTEHDHLSGTPFAELGDLVAGELRDDTFSSSLRNLEAGAGGASCIFATSAHGPVECDLSELVPSTLADDLSPAQPRPRFDLAGHSDGSQDLALFDIQASNEAQLVIFELELE